MKRCPQCRRDHTDERPNFCLEDGATLVKAPASIDGPRKAILSIHETDGQWPTPSKDYETLS